jgi:hypothetical protein
VVASIRRRRRGGRQQQQGGDIAMGWDIVASRWGGLDLDVVLELPHGRRPP